MQKPTTKKPTRRRKATTPEPPDEQKIAASETVAEKTLEPPREDLAPAPDTPSPSTAEEIPAAEVVPEWEGDERQAEETVAVYFRRVREQTVIAAQAKDSTLRPVPPSSYRDDGTPIPEEMTFEADRVPRRDTDADLTHGTPVPDTLPPEPAPLDLPPLPAMLFALILLALAL